MLRFLLLPYLVDFAVGAVDSTYNFSSCIDPRKFGARPGGGSADNATNSAAIQKALDTVTAPPWRTIICLSGGDYYIGTYAFTVTCCRQASINSAPFRLSDSVPYFSSQQRIRVVSHKSLSPGALHLFPLLQYFQVNSNPLGPAVDAD
jgi:hypothetical protein